MSTAVKQVVIYKHTPNPIKTNIVLKSVRTSETDNRMKDILKHEIHISKQWKPFERQNPRNIRSTVKRSEVRK